jgi:hypothetical protein
LRCDSRINKALLRERDVGAISKAGGRRTHFVFSLVNSHLAAILL